MSEKEIKIEENLILSYRNFIDSGDLCLAKCGDELLYRGRTLSVKEINLEEGLKELHDDREYLIKLSEAKRILNELKTFNWKYFEKDSEFLLRQFDIFYLS